MVLGKKDRERLRKGHDESWDICRQDFDVNAVEIRWRNGVVPGVHIVEAYSLDHPVPFGQVWWRWGMGRNELEILHSCVYACMRWLGIRNRLQNWLIDSMKPTRVVSGEHSTPDGIAWMEKFGYKLDRLRGVWRYSVPLSRRSK